MSTTTQLPNKLRLQRQSILDSNTLEPHLQITRTSGRSLLSLSSKSIITLTHPETNNSLGTISFSRSRPEIEIEIEGRELTLYPTSLELSSWAFKPTSPNGSSIYEVQKPAPSWFWKRDANRFNGMVLVDSKESGKIMAQFKADELTFERSGLGHGAAEEVVFTAVALAESVWREDSDVSDLGAALAGRDRSSGGTEVGGVDLKGSPKPASGGVVGGVSRLTAVPGL